MYPLLEIRYLMPYVEQLQEAGFSKRQLYTDDDDIIYHFRRCIGFNGINLRATKADLLDRAIII